MAKKRKLKGMYYTPKHIADFVDGKRIANPSAGSGAFLKAASDWLRSLIQNPPYGKSK
jgi:hypothetical protein